MANYKDNISAILNNDERYENCIQSQSIFESLFISFYLISNQTEMFYASIS
jgi:hypothetical protein